MATWNKFGMEKKMSLICHGVLTSKTMSFKIPFQNILEAEPELDELDHAFICPVCLDLLFEPHKVDPCRHVFCEPCLRRLGCKNPMNTSCPMCRQRISFCEPQRGSFREIGVIFESANGTPSVADGITGPG